MGHHHYWVNSPTRGFFPCPRYWSQETAVGVSITSSCSPVASGVFATEQRQYGRMIALIIRGTSLTGHNNG